MQSPDSTANTLPATTPGRRGTVRRKQLDLAMLDTTATSPTPSTGSTLAGASSVQSNQQSLVSPIKSPATTITPYSARYSNSSTSSQVQATPVLSRATASSPRGSMHVSTPTAPVTIQCTQPTLPRPASPPMGTSSREQQPSLLSGVQRCTSPATTERGNSFSDAPQSQPPTSPTSFNNSPNISPTKLAAIQNQAFRTGSQASMTPSLAPPRHAPPSVGARHQRTESNGSGISVQTVQTHISVQGSQMTAPYSPTSTVMGGPAILRSPNGANTSKHYSHLHVGSGHGSSTGAGAVLGAAKRWFQETKAFFEDGGDHTPTDAYDKTLVVNRSNDLATATGLATRTTKLAADVDFYKRELKRVQGERDKYAAQLESGTSLSASTAPPAPPRVAMWEAQAVSAREQSLRTKLAAAERIAATAAEAVKQDHVAKVQGMAGDLAAHVARTYMLEHQLQWFGVTPVTVAHPEYVVDHVPDEWIQVNERRRKMEEVKANVEQEYAQWLVDAHEAEARVVGKLNEVRAALVDWMDKKSGGKGVKLSDMRKALKEKVERAKEVEKKDKEVVQSLGKVLDQEQERVKEVEAAGTKTDAEGARVERQMSMEQMIKAATIARKKQEEEKKKQRADEAERLKIEQQATVAMTVPTTVPVDTPPVLKPQAIALRLYEQTKDTQADSSKVKPVDSAIAPSKVSSSVAPESTPPRNGNATGTPAETGASAADKTAAPVPIATAKSPVSKKAAWADSSNPAVPITPHLPSKPVSPTPTSFVTQSASPAAAASASSASPTKTVQPPNGDQPLHIPRPFDVSIGSVTASILEPLSLSPKAIPAVLDPATSPPEPTTKAAVANTSLAMAKDAAPTPAVASKPGTSGHDVYQDSAGLLKLDDDLMAMIDFAFD